MRILRDGFAGAGYVEVAICSAPGGAVDEGAGPGQDPGDADRDVRGDGRGREAVCRG